MAWRRGTCLETLEPRQLLAGLPVITEFMAKNDGFFRDGDGNSPDWIEIQNIGDAAIDLAGYRLTDDPSNLARWLFPSVTVQPGEYLVVFASGQNVANYVDAGGNLHTNFRLSGSGEYLALVGPDGTLHSQYGMTGREYPQQSSNISYGVAQRKVLLDGQSHATFWQPLGEQVDTVWRQLDFDPLAYGFSPGQAAMGYESQPDSRNNFSGEILTALTPGTHAVYARMNFALGAAADVSRLELQMKYDNGFVAYLNGVKVAEANAPGDAKWFSTAPERTRRDADALKFESFDLTDHVRHLVDGTNVLAIHGLNHVSDRDDMLLVPQLVGALNSRDAKTGYMATPTPGAENVGDASVFAGVVGETTISVEAGFFDAPFSVTISTQTPDAVIRYTTNGHPPTATSGTVYAGPIQVETTTTLRAAAFKEGHVPSNVDTRSYLFLEDVIRQSSDQPGLPTRWEQQAVVARYPADYEMDQTIVNDPAYRDEIVAGLRSIPTMSIVMDPEALFGPEGLYIISNRHGRESERPISVEIIEPDGSLGIRVNAGLRNHGNRTRDFDVTLKQSLRLVFRSEYGPGKLEYPLFPGAPVDRFDNIVLHAVKILDDPQMVRNSFGRNTNIAMGHPEAHSTHVHLYLNGLYWGIYNPFERPDAEFAAERFGGREQDYSSILTDGTEVVDGDARRYNDMFRLLRTFQTKEEYDALQRQADLDSLIDLLLVNQYMAHDEHEMQVVGRNESDANFRFFAHDLDEKGMGCTGRCLTTRGTVSARSDIAGFLPVGVFQAMRQNPEIRLRFADRAHKHLFNDGALTPDVARERWEGLYQNIFSAAIAETARWGDTHWRTVFEREPARRDDQLAREGKFLREEFFPQRTEVIVDQLRGMGLYPDIAAPIWNQLGGAVPANFQLSMGHPGRTGSILYTLDGSDPRQFGGTAAPGAIIYDASPLVITGNTVVKARVFSDGEWSALTEGEFVVVGPNSPFHLRVTEINYNPHRANPIAGLGEANVDNSQFEFVEITNTSTQAIDVGGVQLASGVKFTFAAGAALAPGERVLVVKNRDAFQSRYGAAVNIAGQFESGTLSDARGLVDLRDANGRRIQSISYSSQDPWPQRANGAGSSLEIIDPFAAASQPTSWRASSQFGGSPGVAGLGPADSIAVTEVLAHSRLPAVDMVELHNRSSAPVNVSNWYVSNSRDNYFKSRIPAGSIIPAGGYHVITETELGFGFDSSRGDDVWLIQADENGKPLRFMAYAQFGPSGAGVSMGPGPDADGAWLPLAEPTFGRANSGLLVGDVIISEVHFAPLDPDGDRRQLKADQFEYVELYNRSNSTQDISHWQMTGGVEVTLPAGTRIDPRQAVLLVPFDPADRVKAPTFRVIHVVDPSVLLVGPYSGTLPDDGGVVRLTRPGQPSAEEPTFTPPLYVDEVTYEVVAPWPAEVVGTGASLTRVSAESFGNSAGSWTAQATSAGSVDFAVRLAGDANEDGRFDQRDLVQVLEGGKYQTGRPATWREGDWNADGVFDRLDLVAALQSGSYLGPLAAIGSGSGVKSAKPLDEIDELDQLFAHVGG
jgi:hypothetical protein